MKLPNSLFFRTATTIGVASLLLVIITLVSLAWFVIIPISKQSADDLAAILILSAQTWVELPPETRQHLEQELLDKHQLTLTPTEISLATFKKPRPYLTLLEEALERRLNKPVDIGYVTDEKYTDWVWVKIAMAEHPLSFGFHKKRVGARPPVALFVISIAILLLAIITALILAHRLSRPLTLLSRATRIVGKGKKQLSLPKSGPDEIIELTAQFNLMANEVNSLLKNRTTLLAGISHDLRTPLTRIKLSLELMSDSIKDGFKQSMIEDVDEIEHRLSDVLQLARGVEHPEKALPHDLQKIIIELISANRHNGVEILYESGAESIVPVPKDTLKRVLQNILENAIRYGDQKPVTIQIQNNRDEKPTICIMDQGPGIPDKEKEAVFQPFYRLEDSRNNTTGGSGLGLAIVQQLCIAQDWQITIQNRHEGGTAVCLKL